MNFDDLKPTTIIFHRVPRPGDSSALAAPTADPFVDAFNAMSAWPARVIAPHSRVEYTQDDAEALLHGDLAARASFDDLLASGDTGLVKLPAADLLAQAGSIAMLAVIDRPVEGDRP